MPNLEDRIKKLEDRIKKLEEIVSFLENRTDAVSRYA